MKLFYFDLVSEFTAHDYVGHQCANRKEAKEHARFILEGSRSSSHGQDHKVKGVIATEVRNTGLAEEQLSKPSRCFRTRSRCFAYAPLWS
jgi:hypothetical protein